MANRNSFDDFGIIIIALIYWFINWLVTKANKSQEKKPKDEPLPYKIPDIFTEPEIEPATTPIPVTIKTKKQKELFEARETIQKELSTVLELREEKEAIARPQKILTRERLKDGIIFSIILGPPKALVNLKRR